MADIAWFVPAVQLATKPLRPPSTPHATHPIRRHRTIFISDIHLGTRGCKAALLADFLARNTCQTLYLVGDIIDGWQLRRRWFWNEAHSRVLQEILRMVDEGVRVVFVPGNHDEFVRPYCGRTYAGIEVTRDAVHETADGKRLLVIHGDQFDGVINIAKWLAHFGAWAYDRALQINELLHRIRHMLGFSYWSLSAWFKHAVKDAVEYVCHFEDAVAQAAALRGLDGVVCGHIHQPQMRTIANVLYLNDGDWVESCTALVEDASGHLEIVRWTTLVSTSAFAGRQREASAVPA